jgi:MFS family permease
LMGMPYVVLLPVIAKEVLHSGAETLGFLTGAAGAGAIAGAIYLASRKSVVGLVRIIALASGLFGTALAAFSYSEEFWISFVCLMGVGFAMITQMASSNTVLQTIVSDEMRGRVMSFYTMAFMGMVPFGALLAGTLADIVGAPRTLLWCGIACLIGSLWFASRRKTMSKFIIPIYIAQGIIPAEGAPQ